MQHTNPNAAREGASGEGFDGAGPNGAAGAAPGARQAAAGGWDPFEIWRTRVRDARREAPSPPET